MMAQLASRSQRHWLFPFTLFVIELVTQDFSAILLILAISFPQARMVPLFDMAESFPAF